jgi:hypothetical protein
VEPPPGKSLTQGASAFRDKSEIRGEIKHSDVLLMGQLKEVSTDGVFSLSDVDRALAFLPPDTLISNRHFMLMIKYYPLSKESKIPIFYPHLPPS